MTGLIKTVMAKSSAASMSAPKSLGISLASVILLFLVLGTTAMSKAGLVFGIPVPALALLITAVIWSMRSIKAAYLSSKRDKRPKSQIVNFLCFVGGVVVFSFLVFIVLAINYLQGLRGTWV